MKQLLFVPLVLLFALLSATCFRADEKVPVDDATSALTNSEPFQDTLMFTTHVYAEKEKEALELDVYNYIGAAIEGPKPVLFFVHGGGFYTGTRKETDIDEYCRWFAGKGFVVVNISYRLYLKGQSFHCDQPSAEKINAFRTAVSDLRSATAFILEVYGEVINEDQVFISGSSAGAEVVLHAPYWDAEEMNLDKPHLFDDFKYAGVLAFAGAMVDTSLITKENMLPMMMYHGTCDPLVPYGSAIHHFCPESSVGGLPLHGSLSIYERLKHLKGSAMLVATCGGKHGRAVAPIRESKDELLAFLQRCMQGEQFQEKVMIEGSLANCKYGKEWSCDE